MPNDNERSLYAEAGSVFRAQIVWLRPANPAQKAAGLPGYPHNLTGATLPKLVIGDQLGTATYLVLTDVPAVDGSVLTLGGETGAIDIYIPDTVTALLFPKIHRYDLFITTVAAGRMKVASGKFYVEARQPVIPVV